MVKWVVSDITEFKTDEHFDLWHDRATFHFLTSESQIAAYLQIAGKAINSYMIVGTFLKTARINAVAWRSNNIQKISYKPG